jgi:hypothetical protein
MFGGGSSERKTGCLLTGAGAFIDAGPPANSLDVCLRVSWIEIKVSFFSDRVGDRPWQLMVLR